LARFVLPKYHPNEFQFRALNLYRNLYSRGELGAQTSSGANQRIVGVSVMAVVPAVPLAWVRLL
jgi:hypothetical protein